MAQGKARGGAPFGRKLPSLGNATWRLTGCGGLQTLVQRLAHTRVTGELTSTTMLFPSRSMSAAFSDCHLSSSRDRTAGRQHATYACCSTRGFRAAVRSRGVYSAP